MTYGHRGSIQSWLRTLVALLAIASVTAGCGFKLRGDTSLSKEIRVIQFEGSTSLREALAVELSGSGVSVVDRAAKPDLVVRARRLNFKRRVLSVDNARNRSWFAWPRWSKAWTF